MADSKEPPKDERVEELLSQLQGIFGKLSRAEEEESSQKVEVTPGSEPAPAPPPVPAAEPAAVGAPPSPNELGTAVFHPVGRENEAKTLARNLESMAPKFTKVTFHLKVHVMQGYESKSDWRESVLARIHESGVRV